MREAARALDDVSDHLGEVLRRADDLLVEWGRFGAQVRDQVEREAAAIGDVVDGAVGRAAATGIDRAIGDRLRALTAELERIEQRTRAASRAVVEQRDADRRILWAVVAGIVLANALLVVLILRKPPVAPVAEPVRLDAPVQAAAPAAPPSATPDPAGAAAGSAAPVSPEAAGAPAATAGSAAAPAAGSGATAGSASGTAAGSVAAARSSASGSGSAAASGSRPAEAGAGVGPGVGSKASAAPPVRPGAPHPPHKKLP